MIEALIVDDERNSSEIMEWQLSRYCPNVKVIGISNNGNDAIDMISSLNPQLVFLDISMPDLNGFQVLQAVSPFSFDVIFTTSYNEFAVKAFKYNALDYLLKPIDIEELKVAVGKCEKKQGSRPVDTPLQKSRKIALTTAESLVFIDPEDIVYCEGSRNYTYFHLNTDPGKVLVSKTLKEVEELLTSLGFFRIHNSYLINMKYIKEFVRGDGGYVVMINGAHLTVSKSRKESFFNSFSKF